MPLVHHELCFGCGRTNLFGLMLEVEPTQGGAVAGRCFIKQDHQGAERGRAHEGVVAAALGEAMALAAGPHARLVRLTVELVGSVAVGSFLDVQASADEGGASALATADGTTVATATAMYASS